MAGWGKQEQLSRGELWKDMARTRTLIMVLIDHKQTKDQLKIMEGNIVAGWLGLTNTDHKA